MQRIPVAGPWITEKEIAYVTDAVTHAWYDQAGAYPQRFEKAFAQWLGTQHAVALPSCTSAIHLALAALGVGPGDEVIVPELTWIASSAPIHYLGADTVFADVDPHHWCLCPKSFEARITPRTKAVIVVDLYGNQPHWPAILEVANRRGIPIIEDAAEALGSSFKGQKAGTFGRVGVFSFHGSKTLTTGEGGMLVTDDETLHQRVLFLRDHGRRPGDVSFFNTEIAYKYKMSALQAALGLAQTERLDELVARKREIFSWYREGLAHTPGISLNPQAPEEQNSYWMVTAMLDPNLGMTKEAVGERLGQDHIDTRPFFHPLSSLPAYGHLPHAQNGREDNPNAYRLSPSGINLPSALSLTKDQVNTVCQALKSLLIRSHPSQ